MFRWLSKWAGSSLIYSGHLTGLDHAIDYVRGDVDHWRLHEYALAATGSPVDQCPLLIPFSGREKNIYVRWLHLRLAGFNPLNFRALNCLVLFRVGLLGFERQSPGRDGQRSFNVAGVSDFKNV